MRLDRLFLLFSASSMAGSSRYEMNALCLTKGISRALYFRHLPAMFPMQIPKVGLLPENCFQLERITHASTAFRHAASCVSSIGTRAARAQARATCSRPARHLFLLMKNCSPRGEMQPIRGSCARRERRFSTFSFPLHRFLIFDDDGSPALVSGSSSHLSWTNAGRGFRRGRQCGLALCSAGTLRHATVATLRGSL